MNKDNIRLDNTSNQINKIFATIDQDIKDIGEIIKNDYMAVKTLSDKKWNTKEKRKMEMELLPYLEIMNNKYENYLNERLVFVKNAVQKYIDKDTELKQEVKDKLVA